MPPRAESEQGERIGALGFPLGPIQPLPRSVGGTLRAIRKSAESWLARWSEIPRAHVRSADADVLSELEVKMCGENID